MEGMTEVASGKSTLSHPGARRQSGCSDGPRDVAHTEGYDSIAIHDGADAIDAAERFRPDCLISDITVPGVDGYEVARRFRSHDIFSPVILIAHSACEDGEKVRAAGFDHHLVKPVSASELTRSVRRLRDGCPYTLSCSEQVLRGCKQ
jgi:CheY-like chemotaxis protein